MDPGAASAHTDGPPARLDEAAWLQGRERRWLPAIVVLVVMVAVTLGGYVAVAFLATPVGDPVGFPGLVSVQPLSGWQPADPGAVQGRPLVQLGRGSAALAIVDWGTSPGDADALAGAVVDELLAPTLTRLSVSDRLEPVVLLDGTPGARFTFVGVDEQAGGAVEGEVTTVVDAAGRGVVFVALVPEGQLSFVDGDIHTMIERAEVV